MAPAALILPPATDPARAFVLGDKLGTGSFGVVYKACVPHPSRAGASSLARPPVMSPRKREGNLARAGESWPYRLSLRKPKRWRPAWSRSSRTNRETGQVVAVKQIDLEHSDDDISEIQAEIAHLAQCDSDYITRYYGSFVKGYKLWIVMEYLAGGSCYDLLKAGVFPERLQGLDYLHSEHKIHRDIKAANVLLSAGGHVKLGENTSLPSLS
jgi:serine/threonine protein kinase